MHDFGVNATANFIRLKVAGTWPKSSKYALLLIYASIDSKIGSSARFQPPPVVTITAIDE